MGNQSSRNIHQDELDTIFNYWVEKIYKDIDYAVNNAHVDHIEVVVDRLSRGMQKRIKTYFQHLGYTVQLHDKNLWKQHERTMALCSTLKISLA